MWTRSLLLQPSAAVPALLLWNPFWTVWAKTRPFFCRLLWPRCLITATKGNRHRSGYQRGCCCCGAAVHFGWGSNVEELGGFGIETEWNVVSRAYLAIPVGAWNTLVLRIVQVLETWLVLQEENNISKCPRESSLDILAKNLVTFWLYPKNFPESKVVLKQWTNIFGGRNFMTE